MAASDPQSTQDLNPSISDGGTRIGRFTIPFPFSVLLGILMIPALIIAAGISIPVTFIRRHWTRRKERRVTGQMRAADRLVSREEATSRIAVGGTFIEEYLSVKGPVRLWWTADDLATVSPHECCWEPHAWRFEFTEFVGWCRMRYTDPNSGTAALIQPGEVANDEWTRLLAGLFARKRCVSVGPRFAGGNPRDK